MDDFMEAVDELVRAARALVDAAAVAESLDGRTQFSQQIADLRAAVLPLEEPPEGITPADLATLCPSCGQVRGYHAEGCGASDEMGSR